MGDTLTCCLRMSEEDQQAYEDERGDDAFDCENCEFRIEHAKLTEFDHKCLDCYSLLNLRVVHDLSLQRMALEAAGIKASNRREYRALIYGLGAIHQRKRPPSDGGDDDRDRDT